HVEPPAFKVRENSTYEHPGFSGGLPFEQRALPDSSFKSPYQKYEVIKPIPGVNAGNAAPWFGKPGKGTQYQLPMSIDELIKEGFIKPIK
ncbi:TNT domain-containing protein, partial [Aeromonas hydrophila]|uniref:TNT domain-containing protein n=1 Tax=Aeromonas hydrophila TaxID=644 RepID=UPI001FF3C939